ncbi:cell wall metabolism sensor histidine kinase WalK [Paenibacillus sp. J5C_2022]|uniref:two-component system histidine kinase PnpS n=1 Tax=Paenibacillus sp. J5C2022 TaxID=2977129 RepID=UPI0021D24DA7|nr:cell wall metabolism sensor histidine kinase WalK [Paenibacillus sp. J5C2022]MCU6710456.1 cell wall metabolism sensor histidine kinase WalK [Paenibacillus sp. J5C2022]
MNSFRTRLTVIIIAMIALSVTASGLFMMKTFKENHINALQDNMVREMQFIAAKMEWRTGDSQSVLDYYTQEAAELKHFTEARVTFIRNDGVVIGDSDYDAGKMDNHYEREEVQGAIKNGVGRSIRKSDTVNQSMMYVAIPIEQIPTEKPYIIRLAVTLDEVDRSVARLTMVLAGGLLILFVIAALISYRIALSMTRPLEQITKVAKRIKNMDYRARVKVTKQDEIGELGTAINAMADSLQVQMGRIKQNESQLQSVLANMINGVVMIDASGTVLLMNRRAEEVLGFSARELVGRHYSDAKQQYELSQIIKEAFQTRQHLKEEVTFYYPEERLLELNLVPISQGGQEFSGILLVLQDVSAIRRLERMRSEFVANVSHELKTPIAAVKGFAETLLGGAVKDEETASSFLKIIYDESDRLNRLIGDILELSKIESRRVPLLFSPVELEGFVDKTLTLLEAEANRKGIQLHQKVESGLFVEADEDRLRQIIMNLLSNGINYTMEGGRVSIDIHALNDDLIRMKISDTGIGIPKKDLPRIFERFYRVDKARSRSSGGTGLGLSIVKHLVELHKGTITVESTVGVGTTFTIDLPVIQ